MKRGGARKGRRDRRGIGEKRGRPEKKRGVGSGNISEEVGVKPGAMMGNYPQLRVWVSNIDF